MATRIDRPALGLIAELGHLYDARRDCFLGASAISAFESPEIKQIPQPSVRVNYISSDSLFNKMTKLDINAGLKISLMSGLVSLDNSISCLYNAEKSSSVVQNTLVCKIERKQEKLVLPGNVPLPIPDSLNLTGATHMVAGITWGANVYASITAEVDAQSSRKEVKANLNATAGKLGEGMLTGGGSMEGMKEAKTCEVTLYGNIKLPTSLPTKISAEEAHKFINNVIGNLSSSDENSVQISYELIPLGLVFQIPDTVNVAFKELDEVLVKQLIDAFETSTIALKKLDDFTKDIEASGLPENDVSPVKDMKDKFELNFQRYRESLREQVVRVRGEDNGSELLEQLRDEIAKGDDVAIEVNKYLLTLGSLDSRKELISLLKKNGVYCVTDATRIRNFIVKFKEVVIFYPSDNEKDNNEHLNKLMSKCPDAEEVFEKKRVFIYAPDVEHDPPSGIHRYKNGALSDPICKIL